MYEFVAVKMVRTAVGSDVNPKFCSNTWIVRVFVVNISVVKTPVTAKLDWKNKVRVLLNKETIRISVVEVSVTAVEIIVVGIVSVTAVKKTLVSVVVKVRRAVNFVVTVA